MDRIAAVEANLDRAIDEAVPGAARGGDDPVVDGSALTCAAAVDLFEDMLRSRVLDVVGREMKAAGTGYYTISSAGHELNAVLGAVTRPTDPALLHYRSGGFVMARARAGEVADGDPRDPVGDTLLSLAASADDPVGMGRHKVWGSRRDWVIPQTSTIGSHPPKATGMAFALDLARRLGRDTGVPSDAIVVCSFGDASANHATTLAGINAARYSTRLGAATPIVFVCEDNGLGISVPTPPKWIEQSWSGRPHLKYLRAEGTLADVHATVTEAVDHARVRRTPVFLHLPTVRLWGHAGSDVESTYRTKDEITAGEGRDPVAASARWLIEVGAATADDLGELVSRTRDEVRERAAGLVDTPHLATADEVRAALFRADADVAEEAAGIAAIDLDESVRRDAFGGVLPEEATQPVKRTMAAHLNAAMTDLMLRVPELITFGEDVGRKGGVYGVTGRLQQAFGTARVFDTLLDETTILGTAQGAAMLGFLPVPEIQYLAYLHNALDQLRGEAGSLSFFSGGQYTNPMVVRVVGLAYQRGFGGHFHNDNAFGAIRDIPGLALAVPSRGDDAARLLRGCVALARAQQRVVITLEPIALYHQRDLHEDGDGGWLTDHPDADEVILPGQVGVHDQGPGSLEYQEPRLLLVTYGNGVWMSRRVARRMAMDLGITVRVLDLRWLLPLPHEAVLEHARKIGRVLVVDEARRTGGIADEVVARLSRSRFTGPVGSVSSEDCYVPLGPAADTVLLDEATIEAAAREVLRTLV